MGADVFWSLEVESIIPWQRMSITQVKKSGEEDIFKDLMLLDNLKLILKINLSLNYFS
jgi:hypothetical protein